METAFKNGVGFYAAATSTTNKDIKPGNLRLYCCRLEAYDLPANSPEAGNISFQLLVAQSEDNPEIARALIQLHTSLGANLDLLHANAKS